MKTINDYAELVKEKHALNKTIAPVETDLTDASRGYHIGEQFIIDGGLFKAKTEIAQHDALVLNTNYEPADDLTTQIKNAGGGTGTDPRLDVFENNIAPVETDETDASKEYQVGEQLILNNILYDVIAPISEHDVITTTGSGANIAPADPISSQFEALTNKLNNEIVTRSALGAKNLLPFDLDGIKELNTAGTWASNVYSYRGVDFTVNPDGTILADGQATGGNASIKVFAATSSYEMLGKNVILNGCPSGGGATSYRIQAYRMGSVDGSSGTYFDDGDGTIAFDALNNASDTVGSFAVAVYENYDADNLLFKPMVRLATDSNGTYQPYAKTNKKLTDDVSSLNTAIANKLSKVIISDISQIPNNDIKDLEDGVYTIILGVLTNPNLLNAPPISSGIQLLVTTASSGFKYFNCVPYNNGLPIYFGGLDTNSVIIGWRPVVVTSNPNLLDNPWFTVDQRGLAGTSWTDNAGVIRLDRWVIDSGDTGSFIDGVVTHTNPLYQTVEAERVAPLLGKTLTLSAMKADGSIVSTTFTLPTTLPASGNVFYGDGPLYFVLFANGTAQLARIHNNTINPKAVKLEIGKVSTLALDTAPNYQQELAKCQRYYVRETNTETGALWLGCYGIQMESNGHIQYQKIMPVPMRSAPTINFSGSLKSWFPSTEVTSINNISIVDNVLRFVANHTTFTADTNAHILFLNGAGYIEYSADL